MVAEIQRLTAETDALAQKLQVYASSECCCLLCSALAVTETDGSVEPARSAAL